MPRLPRYEFTADVWHVYARGNNKQEIFFDDQDRADYLDRLSKTVKKHKWRVLAFCLMGNHVHLAIETRTPELGDGMKLLHGRYAQEFNRRHGRCGHLFQGRFGGVRMRTDEQLWTAIGYVANNPVEAGLSPRAEDWAWGSHAAIAGGSAPGWLDVGRLAEWFGGLDRYFAFVARDMP